MVPADATIQFEFVLYLIVDIGTYHLSGIEPLTLLSPASATATAREAHVVDVIGAGEEHHLQIIFHHGTHASARITLLCTDTEIDIGHQTFVHTFLDTEVEHGFFLTILNAADTGEVALLVVGLDALNDVGGQVLQGCLRVACHELLTIDEDLLDLLTVDLDGSVVADLSTREAFHKFFDN